MDIDFNAKTATAHFDASKLGASDLVDAFDKSRRYSASIKELGARWKNDSFSAQVSTTYYHRKVGGKLSLGFKLEGEIPDDLEVEVDAPEGIEFKTTKGKEKFSMSANVSDKVDFGDKKLKVHLRTGGDEVGTFVLPVSIK